MRLTYLGRAFQNLSIVLMVTCLSGGGDFTEQEAETLAGRERGGRGERGGEGRDKGGEGEGEGKRRRNPHIGINSDEVQLTFPSSP